MARVGNECKLVLKLAEERVQKLSQEARLIADKFVAGGDKEKAAYQVGYKNGLERAIRVVYEIHAEIEG